MKRRVTFGFLYFSEGAPIGFIWWALPTLLREDGMDIGKITALTSTLLLPWLLKFLWAPLIDVAQSPRWTLKHWILTSQSVMVLALLPLCVLSPADHFPAWMTLLLVHGFAAATQDASIDALAIRTVPDDERGRVNGAMQLGMLLGRSLFGGAILAAASRLGSPGMIGLLVAAIAVVMFLVVRMKVPPADTRTTRRHLRSFFLTLGAAFRRRSTWAGLVFALLSGAAFEASGAMAGPMLLDAGAARHQVGSFFALPVVLAMTAGALLGGAAADRVGVRKACGFFLAGFTLAVILTGTAWLRGMPDTRTLFTTLGAMYLFVGMFTAASYAMFMNLTNPALGATQFCVFMAATNACEAWSGRAGGFLAAGFGYGTALLVLCAVSIIGLACLPFLSREPAVKSHRPITP